MVLTGVVLPIFFIVFIGFLLQRFGRLDVRVFSRTQLYVLSPALVFYAMARAEASTVLVLNVFLYIAILSGVILGIAQGLGFALRRDRLERNAISLTAVFMNSGFYGIPVCMLAFGEKGLVYATTYVVASSAVQCTLGIFIANAGRMKPSSAVLSIFRIPIIYSIVLARFLVHFDLMPPEPLMKMINLLGQSAIPIGLLLLGMQLERVVEGIVRGTGPGMIARSGVRHEKGASSGATGDELTGGRTEPRDIASGLAGGFLRIAGGFCVALLLIRFFNFDPVLRSVIIVESSMPTAVNMIVYATEFNCRPKLVAVGVLGSTLASALSVTLILGWLT